MKTAFVSPNDALVGECVLQARSWRMLGVSFEHKSRFHQTGSKAVVSRDVYDVVCTFLQGKCVH